jgi:hypothetical protein
VARPYGDAGRAALKHWTVVLWRLAILVSLVLSFAVSSNPPATFTDLAAARSRLLGLVRNQILFGCLRLVVAGLFLATVWVLHQRLRDLTSQGSVRAHLLANFRLWRARRESRVASR